jgi:hypothetical protein
VAVPAVGKDPLRDVEELWNGDSCVCVYSKASSTMGISPACMKFTPWPVSMKLVTLAPSAETVKRTLPPPATVPV